MKTTLLFFLLSLLSIQGIYSQTDDANNKIVITDKDIHISLYPNPVENILFIKTTQPIECVRLYNKQGVIVLQSTPVDNQISLVNLESGFYLFCAYVGGVKVKKGILKKV